MNEQLGYTRLFDRKMRPEPYDKKMDDKATEEFKPLTECQTIGDILITCAHLVRELNTIPGVKAKMGVQNEQTD